MLGLVGVLGCNDKCTGTYNCPIDGAFIALPSDISGRVTSATGDTCTAQADGADSFLRLTSASYRPYRVELRLDHGTTRSSTVTLQSLDDGCNGHTAAASPFEQVDGAAGG